MMNEILPALRLSITENCSFHYDHMSIDNDNESVDHAQDVSFLSAQASGSTYTGTTRSLSDISMSKSSIVGEPRQRLSTSGRKWPFIKSISSPSPTKTKELHDQPAVRRTSVGKRRICRKLIAGMISKVRKGSEGDSNSNAMDHSENEVSGGSDSFLIVEPSIDFSQSAGSSEGVSLPATPPFRSDDIQHRGNNKQAVSNELPSTSKRCSESCDQSVLTEEVFFESDKCEDRFLLHALPTTPPLWNKEIHRGNLTQELPTQPLAASRSCSESCDQSVMTEEVQFEPELPLTSLFADFNDGVDYTGNRKKPLMRASSDITADERKVTAGSQQQQQQPKRSSSSRELHYSSEAKRDVLPRLPPRQRSFEKLLPIVCEDEQTHCDEVLASPPGPDLLSTSRRTCNSNSTRSSGTSTGTSMSGEQIQAYVMSHMPQFVQQQLPDEEWKRIFSEAAVIATTPSTTTQKSPHSTDITPSNLNKEQDLTYLEGNRFNNEQFLDDDCITEISCLTSPFSMEEVKEDADSGALDTDKEIPKVAINRAAVPSRSWHEGSSTHESAPQLPRRYSHGEVAPMNAQVFPTSKVFHDEARGSFHAPTRPTRINSRLSQKVVFSKVHVRYYERILEVNPCTSSGPSVGIGWKYKEMDPVDFAFVEEKPTDYRNLVLPRQMREKMLYDLGYKRTDLAKAVRLNLKLKNQRAQTYNNLRHEKVEYLVEKSKRKVGQMLRSFGPAKRD